MTVDAHHHVRDLAVRDQDWIRGPRLAVLVQTVTAPEETPEPLALAAGHGLVAGVVGWTDLTHPGVADALARLRALPGGPLLEGVRHQVQAERDPEWLLRTDVPRELAAVADAGLVHDLAVLPRRLPACARAAALLPRHRPPLARACGRPRGADRRAR